MREIKKEGGERNGGKEEIGDGVREGERGE